MMHGFVKAIKRQTDTNYMNIFTYGINDISHSL